MSKDDKKEEVEKTLFQQLRAINVNAHVEKKNGFNYLSWAWALDVMYQFDDNATFTFPEREAFLDGSVMIYCDVTIKGKTKRGFLPVMDNKNNALKNPDARKISDSMQRCLVKTISLHGLGLSLYAGEDLPDESKETEVAKPKTQPKAETKPFTGDEFSALLKLIKAANSADELKIDWDKFNSAKSRMTVEMISTLTNAKNAKKVELENKEMDGSHE